MQQGAAGPCCIAGRCLATCRPASTWSNPAWPGGKAAALSSIISSSSAPRPLHIQGGCCTCCRPQGSPHFFCCKISSLAIPNRRSNEARRCQGYHCAVKTALLEEYDRAEQVMADDFQVKNSIK